MNCPECASENTTKAIAMAMPMKLCIDCGNIWGFFSYIYVVFAMLESALSGGYCIMLGYEGTYWEALKVWAKGPDDDE
jgi:hypothetical protein